MGAWTPPYFLGSIGLQHGNLHLCISLHIQVSEFQTLVSAFSVKTPPNHWLASSELNDWEIKSLHLLTQLAEASLSVLVYSVSPSLSLSLCNSEERDCSFADRWNGALRDKFTLLEQVHWGKGTQTFQVPGLSYVHDPSWKELRSKGVKHYGHSHQNPHP